MFDFATAVLPGITGYITTAMGLVDPTTLIGGLVAVGLGGGVAVKLVKRVTRLAK
jgi:vancomycin resistance protein YoaR